MKYVLAVILCCLTLTGCEKKEEPVSNVVLDAPVVEDTTPVVVEETQETEQAEPESLPTFETTNRTNIMVSDDNKDTFNKREEEQPTEEPVEVDPTLSRFKKNQDNIKFPTNYKVSGNVMISADKVVSMSVSRTKNNETYAVYNYENVILEQFIVDDSVSNDIKEVYVTFSQGDKTIDGRVNAYAGMDITNYSDFKVLGINNVSKNGNNYKLDSSFVVNSQQVDGIITVGDNMNVYNINYVLNGIEYDLRVQTLLKLPKTKVGFSAELISYDDETIYREELSKVFNDVYEQPTMSPEQTHMLSSSGVREGWIDYNKKVDAVLDEVGQILYINVIETYSYDDGSTSVVITKKDLEGNILETSVDGNVISATSSPVPTANPTTEVQQEEQQEEEVEVDKDIIVLKPTFTLDENISSDDLEIALRDWDNQYVKDGTLVYSIVDIGDPTRLGVDFVAKEPLTDENSVKVIISKFADDNFTAIVEWR